MSPWKPPRDASGFHLLEGPGPIAIWIESNRIAECMAFYRSQDISRIAVSPLMGYSLSDLEFLKDHPYVRGVELPTAGEIDVSGLRYLSHLESLNIAENRQPLDLAQFGKLTRLAAEWHPKLRLGSQCRRLRILGLRKYRPKSKDLTELAKLPALEDLSIVQSPLNTIRGAGQFRKLRRLHLSYLTKLESILAIRELRNGRLEVLDCQKCRKIGDHHAVRTVSSLRVVKFNDCGNILTIGFLDDMPALEEFRFVNSNVVDGDLRPLLRLKSVGFFKKKHYSHTPEEVNAIIDGNAEVSS